MNCVPFHEGPYLMAYFPVGRQVHCSAKKVFQVELGSKVAAPVRWSVKPYEDVDVAFGGSLISGKGTV